MDAPTSEAPQYRLWTGVCPTHYELTVRTDLESLKFDGFVSIEYTIRTPSH
jgi:aminopeptidase 2